jgi:uncharacterized membrane protein
MNMAHLHLLLNHVPTVGFGIGVGLLLVALAGRDDKLTRLSLGVLFLIALLAIATYQTGNAAAEAIERLPGVSQAFIDRHQDAALLAFLFIQITGAVAWLGLWQFRRISRPTRRTLSAVLVLSIVTFGLMARAADIGGEIRHPEIRSSQEAAATEGTVGSGTEWIRAASLKSFVLDIPWVWPAGEAVHFIGLSLSFGVVLLLNLRMLGMMKILPFAALHRLLPWGILGVGINLMSGMLFFIASPEQYTQNAAFQWKMLFMLVAGANLLYFTLFDEAWAVGRGDDAPVTAKVMAASTIFLWVGVIYFGRMLPYIGNSF